LKIVIDANIFVSAIFWGGFPKAVLVRVAEELDTLFITKAIVYEIQNVLIKPKFRLTAEIAKQRISEIEALGNIVVISPKHRVKGVCRDPKDDMYLECAISADADYIISGDFDLLDIKEYGGIKIVNARDYLDIATA